MLLEDTAGGSVSNDWMDPGPSFEDNLRGPGGLFPDGQGLEGTSGQVGSPSIWDFDGMPNIGKLIGGPVGVPSGGPLGLLDGLTDLF